MTSRSVRSAIWRGLRGLLVSLAVLVLLEGAASVLLLAYDVSQNATPPLAERFHTRYDEQIGWVNEPDVRLPDLYAPGVNLSTNARGFRGQREYADAVPAGIVRVVCTGDSFTLGYGTGDEDTWPRRMEVLDPRLECPNLGQGGYGIDQAYLWYLRAGAGLEHHVQLFAFITYDFERMRNASFQLYGKPLLRLDGDGVAVSNTPVPRSGYRWPWVAQNANLLRASRSLQLFERARLRLAGPTAAVAPDLGEAESEAIAAALLTDLVARNRAAGRLFVLVYLPVLDPAGTGWRTLQLSGWPLRACAQAVAAGALRIDLWPAFEALTPEERQAMFLSGSACRFPGAGGHYSVGGNAFVAQHLLQELEKSDAFRALRDRRANGAGG